MVLWASLPKNYVSIGLGVNFWTLNSIPLICVSILILVPGHFDCYDSVLCFEFRKHDTSILALFSQNCFGYPGHFLSLYKLLCVLFYSFWEIWWDLDRDCAKFVYGSGQHSHLMMLNLPVYEHRMFLHFFESFIFLRIVS